MDALTVVGGIVLVGSVLASTAAMIIDGVKSLQEEGRASPGASDNLNRRVPSEGPGRTFAYFEIRVGTWPKQASWIEECHKLACVTSRVRTSCLRFL